MLSSRSGQTLLLSLVRMRLVRKRDLGKRREMGKYKPPFKLMRCSVHNTHYELTPPGSIFLVSDLRRHAVDRQYLLHPVGYLRFHKASATLQVSVGPSVLRWQDVDTAWQALALIYEGSSVE